MLQISGKMGNLIKLVLLLCIGEINSLRMMRDFSRPTVDTFQVYWNVPTYMCKKHKINFEPELTKYGITVNKNDDFRGEKILILYDPGSFPIMLKDTATGKLKEHNGGIPQSGDLDLHKREFTAVVDKVVPKNFDGLAIIDFEIWRPIFRQNWNDQVIYRNMSMDLVRQNHPQWTEKQIMNQAKLEFEKAARLFMEETLKLASTLRPNAKWGYYGFPYCFNYARFGTFDCPALVKKENDQIHWLFEGSQAFYLSLYSSKSLTTKQLEEFVTGRLNEAWRLSNKVSETSPPQVYPYVWYRHNDAKTFLSQDEMHTVLSTTKKYKMGGAIIWGSSSEVKTQTQCQDLFNYLTTTLGPAVKSMQ